MDMGETTYVPGTIVEYKGQRARVLANGTLQAVEGGKFLTHGVDTTITPANARTLASKRWDAYRDAAIAGLAEITPANQPTAAWQHIVKRQAQLAADTDKGRASTEAARFVGQAVDALPDRTSAQNQAGMSINIGADVAMRLLSVLMHSDIVDSVVVGIEPDTQAE